MFFDVHLSKAFIITDELNVFESLLHFESVLRKKKLFMYHVYMEVLLFLCYEANSNTSVFDENIGDQILIIIALSNG